MAAATRLLRAATAKASSRRRFAWRPAGAASLLGGLTAVGGARRGCAAECDEKPHARRRPVSGTSGVCDSGVRYYAARSKAAESSPSLFAVSERLHHFAVVDGLDGDDGGAGCARFFAQRLPRMITEAFVAQPSPMAMTGVDGQPLGAEDVVAAAWANSLTAGFGHCDSWAAQEEVLGSCGALVCVVARSGIYVASIGLGRAVVGTEDDGGKTIQCDEASSPHCAASELEATRLGDAVSRFGGPTRMLGGMAQKRVEPLISGLPDVVRHGHAAGRRFVILGSPALWVSGPRLPLEWVVEAYRKNWDPAVELVARSKGDVVALVLVLPPGLDDPEGPLPPHDEAFWPPAA